MRRKDKWNKKRNGRREEEKEMGPEKEWKTGRIKS